MGLTLVSPVQPCSPVLPIHPSIRDLVSVTGIPMVLVLAILQWTSSFSRLGEPVNCPLTHDFSLHMTSQWLYTNVPKALPTKVTAWNKETQKSSTLVERSLWGQVSLLISPKGSVEAPVSIIPVFRSSCSWSPMSSPNKLAWAFRDMFFFYLMG